MKKGFLLQHVVFLYVVSVVFASVVFGQPASVGMAIGETLVWDAAEGADHYKIEVNPTAEPTNIQTFDNIFGDQFDFPEGTFTTETQYTIKVWSADCCGALSATFSSIKYYIKQGPGGDCCHESIVKDNNSACYVSVRGHSYFYPGGIINTGCQ